MFDKLRIRRILNKQLTPEKYLKLSDEFQHNEEIIQHLIESDKENITIIPDDVMLEKVKKDNTLLDYLSDEQLSKLEDIIPNIDKDIYNEQLSEKVQYFILFHWPKKTFDLLCDVDMRRRLLLTSAYLKTNPDVSLVNDYGYDIRELFTDDEYRDILMSLPDDEFKNYVEHSSEYNKPGDQLVYISTFDVAYIIELCQKHSILFRELLHFAEFSDVVDEIMIQMSLGDADKLYELGEKRPNALAKLCTRDPKYLIFSNRGTRDKYYELKKDITLNELMFLDVNSYNVIYSMKEDEALSLIQSDFEYLYSAREPITGHDWLEKKLSKIKDVHKKEKLFNLFYSLTDRKIIDNPGERYNERNQFFKILFDERIVNSNSIEKLEEYRKTFDRDLFIELLANAYGEHVRIIFEERKELNIFDLYSFSMFDKDIYDLLGKKFVIWCIAFKLGFICVLLEKISQNKGELLAFCNYFNCIISNMDHIGLNDIHNIVEKYMIYENIFKNINFDELSEQQVNNILLLINDSKEMAINVNSIDDLNNYHNIRRDVFKKHINKLNSYEEIQEEIFHYITNTEWQNDLDSHSNLDKPSFKTFLAIFDIDNIVNNEKLIEDVGLTKEEVAVLLLLTEINKMTDVNELRETFESILTNQLDARSCHKIMDKLRNYFTQNIKKNITGIETLDEMKKKTKNDVEIVKYEGEDFRFLVSYMGVNLSSEGEYYRTKIFGKNLLDLWLYHEDGYNYISTSLVSSKTSIYPLSEESQESFEGHIIFAFGQDVDIIGMGPTDILASHWKKNGIHTFNNVNDENHTLQFTTMDNFEKQINSRTEDDHKFANEVTTTRYKEDIRKDDAFTRVMPIGIYVVGNITKEQMETARVFNEYYKAHGLGKFRIIQINPKKYDSMYSDEEKDSGKGSKG